MNMNMNKGKGLISDVIDSLPPKSDEKLLAEAAKLTAFAENSADKKSITKHVSKTKEPYYIRSYRMSETNVKRLDELKHIAGSDFNFQVNKALDYWFENVHPEVKI